MIRGEASFSCTNNAGMAWRFNGNAINSATTFSGAFTGCMVGWVVFFSDPAISVSYGRGAYCVSNNTVTNETGAGSVGANTTTALTFDLYCNSFVSNITIYSVVITVS
jgi:hypothetical protein